ncbi:mRNA cap guanine-N7 methyltransferase 2 [Platanthera zijinensis]|uniref:mRNA cap guanine-N7 methyltransferase 2 n=1 Tax=Platanthera zijinensis TaxID=2320716 RepID=A0AAP0BRK8_9ASPA
MCIEAYEGSGLGSVYTRLGSGSAHSGAAVATTVVPESDASSKNWELKAIVISKRFWILARSIRYFFPLGNPISALPLPVPPHATPPLQPSVCFVRASPALTGARIVRPNSLLLPPPSSRDGNSPSAVVRQLQPAPISASAAHAPDRSLVLPDSYCNSLFAQHWPIDFSNPSRTKYQKIVEISHNKGSGLKAVQNCIRSDNYVITFEVEEEKFPFFGKKYMLKFGNDIVSETHC